MAKPEAMAKLEELAAKLQAFVIDINAEKRVATIAFNKPERLNALTLPECRKLGDVIEDMESDPDVKVIVLKGIGRAFGSGDDMTTVGMECGLTDEDGKPASVRPPQWRRFTVDDKYMFGPRGLLQTLSYCNKATIAQVHGYCYGAHLGIALACDITIASEETLFTHAGFRYMGPSAEGFLAPWFLNVGPKKTMELMLTGRPFGADEAQAMGLVNHAVPEADLEREVERIAKAITLLSLDGIVMGKYATRLALDRLGYGGITPVVAHAIGTNVQWEQGDFNMYKAKRDHGTKGAFSEREARYAELGMDLGTVKAQVEERLAKKRLKK